MSDKTEETIHSVLIIEAAKWLRKKGCSVVITDMSHGQSETPDAIGWHGTHSILVECKASLADFRADAGKFFRRNPEQGMGAARYMCAMRGMIAPDKLPSGWGLIEWDGKKMRQTVVSQRHELSDRGETSILLSAIRRIGAAAPAGVSVKCYTIESKNRATIGIEPPDDGTE